MKDDKKVNVKNINEMTSVGTKILKILYLNQLEKRQII